MRAWLWGALEPRPSLCSFSTAVSSSLHAQWGSPASRRCCQPRGTAWGQPWWAAPGSAFTGQAGNHWALGGSTFSRGWGKASGGPEQDQQLWGGAGGGWCRAAGSTDWPEEVRSEFCRQRRARRDSRVGMLTLLIAVIPTALRPTDEWHLPFLQGGTETPKSGPQWVVILTERFLTLSRSSIEMSMFAGCGERTFIWSVPWLICCNNLIPEAPFTVFIKIKMSNVLQQNKIQLKSHLHTELWRGSPWSRAPGRHNGFDQGGFQPL